jgi:hypothetical protein
VAISVEYAVEEARDLAQGGLLYDDKYWAIDWKA